MARPRLPVAPHLSPEGIARRDRACRSGIEKAHWQALWPLTRTPTPPTPTPVAAQVGLTPAWVRTPLRRWDTEGPAGLADRRPARDGGRPELSAERQAALSEALQGRPDDGGLWTGPKAAAYARTRWGGSSATRPAGSGCGARASPPGCPGPGTRRPPRRRGSGPGKGATDRWVAEPRRPHPDKQAEVWAEGEARPGLEPIARRIRAPKGRRPTAHGRTKYRWVDVYAFVHPASGRDPELIPPAADTDWMALALAGFARWADPEGRELMMVLVGNAGRHVAKRPAIPPDVVLRRLPACAPELRPAEPLWPPVREAVGNRGFDALDRREPVLVGRCRWLIEHPEVVRGAVGSYWAAALNG